MSKSSTASSAKNPAIPRSSAWSRGPPLPSSTPSRSQSPAPSNIPVQSHSRRPSTLSGVPIKDGVTIPKNNISAVKQGSAAVTFGSIDDVSAPISSSPPITAPSIKSEGVKSFGTIEADAHVNGKPALSSRPSAAVSTSSTKSTTSTPAVSVASHAHPVKLAKTDIAKLFQNPTSAPSSQPSSDTSSPSLRSTNLPSSSQPGSSSHSQSSTPSQPSQLGSHSFTPFVPRPQQQTTAPGAPRSPAWPSRQVANGTGGRPQGGPNGAPSQMNPGMASPRLAPHPHNGQPSNMPPPPQMQPSMPQQMHAAWPQYYYPAMPDQHYYNPAWYGVSPSPHHPPPGGPHGPPHPGMPISPRNPPMQLQSTPTMSHATASPAHPPHPPPPLSHTSSSMSSISSPPPTPSSATSRLSGKSNPFVPSRSSAARITFRKPDGEVVSDIRSLTHPDKQGSMATVLTAESGTPTNGQPPKPRQESPGTPTRPVVRLETEEQHKKRLEEEERAKAEAGEEARKKKEEEERKSKDEEKRKQQEEERKKREVEEKERERIRKEEEEKERVRKEEEEKKRLRQEAEAKERLRREEEEKERRKKEEAEKERIRKEEEQQERLRKEEEERQRREEEERQRKEEEERQRQEEERKRKEEEEERMRKEEEEEQRDRLRKEEEEKERLRREEEEAAAKARAEAGTPAKAEEGIKKDVEYEAEPLEEGEIVSSPKETKEKAKETLRINTSDVLSKKRPGRLDLSNTGSVPAPLPSALATARAIDDLGRVSYPDGIQSPKAELNLNAKDGKFRYDRDFLLQFMSICKEKPDMLPPLDAIGLEPIDQSSLMMTRGGSGRHRQASGNAVPARSGSIALGFNAPTGFGKSTSINPFAAGGMGNFSTSGARLTSEERFQLASGRSASVGGPAAVPFGRPIPMQRTASQGGPGGPLSSNRTRSQRGKQRGDPSKMGGAAQQAAAMAQAANMEPVAPLKVSENRWDRRALQVETDSPEMVDRKVRGLLNKLTMERFDSISDQIIEWANKSEKEKDGRTLIQVIRLVFEKATDEATWSEMYARLCRKMMERISSKVEDDGIRSAEGKPITGGQLFRKYLLNRCQEDFERGWVAKEATAAAAATKAMEDEAVKAANEKNKESGTEEVALYSEEYYAAQKAKRQGLGLIKFIGELFKLQMLTERIMHECIKKLLGNVNNPEEEEIESLCKLLTTVGKILDNQKAHGHMSIYFQRMKELTRSPNVSPRMQFMLQDVIELRERGWVPRNAINAPTTIAQIHEAAGREKAAQEKEYSQRQISMSRGGSRRGGDRSDHPQVNPEGWTTAGGAARPASKAGDLTNFGKISKAVPTTFGPGSVFAGKKADKRESLSRTSSSSNMFSMLQSAESVADKEQPQRRKLVLMPRTKPIDQAEPQQQQHESSEEEDTPTPAEAGPEMSEESAKKKIEEDSKEFFGIRNLDEAEVYFTTLPASHHHSLVDKLVSTAVELKEADAQLVGDFFARAVSKNLCSVTAFEEGLAPIAEVIEDIAIDAPKAYSLLVTMVKGAGLDEERRSRLASKSMDGGKLLALLS